MHILAVGVDYKTAPVEVRERLSFSGQEVGAAARALATAAGLYEVVLLSTCNRTEAYGVALSGHARFRMAEAVARLSGLEPTELEPHLWTAKDREAVEHLYRVAAGLESLVMGEPQILGQVRGAYEAAHEAGMTGPRLSKLFLTAI